MAQTQTSTERFHGIQGTTVYTDGEFPAHYGDWRDRKTADCPVEIFMPARLCGSDYSGTLIEHANRAAWKESFNAGEDVWWTEISGGHGTAAIVLNTAKTPTEALCWLENLDDDIVADGDKHSELEMESQNDAWNGWAKAEFKKLVEEKIGVDVIDDDDKLFDVFQVAADITNTYWVNEQGDASYIDLRRIVDGTDNEILRQLVPPLKLLN